MAKAQKPDKYNQILQSLGEWDSPLPPFVELYAHLLRLQTEVKPSIVMPDLTDQGINDQLRQGLPVLKFKDLILDWPLVQRQFEAITNAIAEHLTLETHDVEGLRRIATNAPLLQQAISNWYQELPLSSIATEHHISENVFGTVTQATLRPFLIAHTTTISPLIKQDLWRRRRCPICGGKPDFAFLDKDKGARWLLCSRCDTQWLFQRLECPYCGTQNHESLSYFISEDKMYRLYTCEECRGYIKAIDLRETESEILLPLERVLTADLDRQAGESGYSVS